MNDSYSQPQKNEVRRRSLKHAVEILTSRRSSASVVPKDHLRKILAAIGTSDSIHDKAAVKKCTDETVRAWEEFWEGKVGSKRPGDLMVAYLAGPEPLNDFLELVGLGVNPRNILAFESDVPTFNQALQRVKISSFPLLKIIKVPLDRYLQTVPCSFDIIYFDACGPLPSPQGTLRTVANVFRYQRLNPLGVLITNFSKPDISNSDILDSYSDLVSSYLYPKGMVESESPDWNLTDGPRAHSFQAKCEQEAESYFHSVRSEFGRYYGQYITRQIFDIASFNAPMSRFANSEMWSSLFSQKASEIAKGAKILQHFAEANDEDDSEEDSGGYYIVDPDMNALGWTMTALLDAAGDENYPVLSEPWKRLAKRWHDDLSGSPNVPIDAKSVVHSYAMIRNQLATEGVMKPAMFELIKSYDFMGNMHMFPDGHLKLPHLWPGKFPQAA